MAMSRNAPDGVDFSSLGAAAPSDASKKLEMMWRREHVHGSRACIEGMI